MEVLAVMQVDLVVRDVKVFNSYLKKFITGNVAILNGQFLYISDYAKGSHEAINGVQVIDGRGQYMIPGLIDIHLHIESTMITPQSFSYGLIRNGVTTIVPEPHEMANVFGVEGVKEMIKVSKDCTVDMMYAIPSSVPATAMETTGGSIEIQDIDELLRDEKMKCLGEIMNYVDIINDPDCKTNQILNHVRKHYPELIIEGHCPKVMDLDLHRIIYSGVGSDHTHQSIEGMEARISSGMFIELQEKSMTQDIIDYLIQHDVAEHFCFVTDDVMADSFAEHGHLNHIVTKAIEMGMSPEQAIYAATFTPAKRMNMYDRGVIAPGKLADFVLLSDLNRFEINQVFKSGQAVYDKSQVYKQPQTERSFPDHFYQSVKLSSLHLDDFVVKTDKMESELVCRVMMVKDGSTFTEEHHASFSVTNGTVAWEHSDYGLIATFERYGKNGNRAYGFIGGDTIKRGAIATTYSHDNHNLLVVGRNAADMVLAANEVIQGQGGFCVVEDGKVLAHVALPVGGILTEVPLVEAAKQVKQLRQAMEYLGYQHYNPIMSISTHSLPVSPALKITDHGLIDVNKGIVVPLVVE